MSSMGKVDFWVRAWLLGLCGMVMMMVLVGGVTRLTGSGLSIVEWKPIMGAIPPLSESDWWDAFRKYQEFPQFKLQNSTMTLGEFKFIFFWEYFHRLLGRSIGVVFLLPWLYFLIRKKMDRNLARRTAIGFLLGGAQGLVGWVMVQSGLVDRPSVSHIRLAIHLCLALVILVYLFWIFLNAGQGRSVLIHPRKKSGFFLLWVAEVLFALQVVYGAFVAGLKAGYIHNTYPTMSGEWFPSLFFALDPVWRNIFENPVAVQFVHRWLAIALGVIIAVLSFKNWKRIWAKVLFGMVLLQILMGILTLILKMPLVLAVAHQSGASFLLLILVYAHDRMSKHSEG